MKITPAQDKIFHQKLPIDPDEVVIAAYRHHAVAYVIPLLLALFVISVLAGLAVALTNVPAGGGSAIISDLYRPYIIMGVGIFSFLVLIFTYIPVWVKTQDQLVLTNEALIQVLQTSLFSNKVSQLGLQHVTDVTVKAGFWGNLLGFGHITVETPGEQDNYEYRYLPNANSTAREIVEAHERFTAALESGQIHLQGMNGSDNVSNSTWQKAQASGSESPVIMVDPAEYQKFLEYQKQQNGQNSPPPQA